MNSWFQAKRYGMFVHANIATVPAFAPMHEYADWYWGFLETKPDIVLHPTCPLPEVVAWHREHFGDQPFDDFIPDLTFERFDPDAYAQLLDDAGMRYLVHVTKHHDGFCWWDSAHTTRNSVALGPHRDVVAELAAAVRRRGHQFGCYYSLLDWSHADYPDPERYVDAFMRPQIRELVERFEPAVLWGDGHWGHPGGHWRADKILGEARAYAAEHGFEIVCNDRFFASEPDFVTFEYDVPAVPPDRLWEVCRGLGSSFCVNRNESVDDFLTAREIVAMLVETVAKGGNLLLNVGPNADGTVPDDQARLLRESGEWVRAHADAIHGSTAFDVPGSGRHWYTRTDDVVQAFDLSSAPEPCFTALAGATSVTTPAGEELVFRASDAGAVVDARAVDRHPYGARYCFRVHADAAPIRVTTRNTGGLAALLAGAAPGAVVDVPAGRYDDEAFPIVVPAGVTLRGESAARVTIDAGGTVAVVLGGDGAALVGVTVTGGSPGYMMIPPTCVTGQGANGLSVRDCHVESIGVVGGHGHVVTGNVIAGGKVWLLGATGCEVRANYQHGLRWGAGIEVQGGEGHVIAENELRDDLCAIKCVETVGARIERNRYETRWFGIHLLNAIESSLYRNRAWRTMRAVTVEGGRGNRIEKQLAEHCDSGAVVEGGAVDTVIAESWFHDCRVGVFMWGAGAGLENTAISESREHEIVTQDEARVVSATVEQLLIALWRAPDADVESLLDTWIPPVLDDPGVESCTISFADPDQGPYVGPPCDVLIELGLARAQDLDDLPERHELYAVAREVNVFRVDPRRVIEWERTWPDGEYAPGVKYVSFVRRAEELSHGQFVRHWTEVHAPLARTHHVGLADYTQNVVRATYTPGGGGIDGVAELRFRTRADFEDRFYDSDAGKAIIRADVKKFIGRSGISPTLMRELPLRTPSP